MSARGDQLLLPVNPWFLWGSLLVALVFELVPLGRQPALPDLLAVVLAFWVVHEPRRVGMGAAFVFGLLIDVHQGALLGQHALAYTLLAFLATMLQRRLLWFDPLGQAAHVLPLFAAAHAVALLVRLLTDRTLPGWSVVLAPLVEAALWPIASWLLLAPQRRAPDRDQNRPL